jgi:hypothetical protein
LGGASNRWRVDTPFKTVFMKRDARILMCICALSAVLFTRPVETQSVSAQAQHGVLRIVHDAPHTPPVVILVEGQTVIQHLSYHDQSPDVSLGPGMYRVDVVEEGVNWDGGPAGGTPSLTNVTVTIVASQIQTFHLIDVDGAVQLNVVPVEARSRFPAGFSGQLVWGAALIVAAVCGMGLLVLRRRNR